jgi:hypothetical protein
LLSEKGIGEEDIADLEAALEEEPHAVDGKLGPKVAGWFGRMVKKAADGTWKIGIGAAGTLLAEAIGRYYGWSS